jgi:HlyD family secretion protein
MMINWVRGAMVFALLGAGLHTLAACDRLVDAGPRHGQAPPPRSVSIATIELRQGGGVSASGYLVARDPADIGPELAGYRVAKVLVDEGAVVKAGQPLAVLDDALLRAQIDQQLALSAQQATLVKQATAEAQRGLSVQGSGVVSDEAVQARIYKADAARSAERAQQAQLKDLEVRRAHLIIRAPVGGLVLERNVQAGDVSSFAAPPMFRIASDNQIELEAQVSEGDLYRIAVGDPADVTLSDGAHLSGTVRRISPRVDAKTKLGAVRIAFAQPRDLQPLRGEAGAATPRRPFDLRVGAFAAARFTGGALRAASAPEAAVRYDPDGASVMVLDADNRVHKTPVRTGPHSGGFVQLLEGPPPGSRILLGAAAFVVDGEVVSPVTTPAPGSAPPPVRADR